MRVRPGPSPVLDIDDAAVVQGRAQISPGLRPPDRNRLTLTELLRRVLLADDAAQV